MTSPTPSIGRIVHYTLTEQDAQAINKRRTDFEAHRTTDTYADTGYVAHYGNTARAGYVFPAVIVSTWSGTSPSANLRVLLDGTDDLWTASTFGDGPGQWIWPPRV